MKAMAVKSRKARSFTLMYPFKAYSHKKTPARPTRRLVLIDIENYCGKGVLQPEDIRMAKEKITRDFSLGEEDLVVIGTSHGNNCLVSGVEWRGPRQVLMRGHDGADLALIKASKEYKLETFAAVIMISGDGIFTDTAEMVKSQGKPFVIASRREALSRNLAIAASAVRYVRPAA